MEYILSALSRFPLLFNDQSKVAVPMYSQPRYGGLGKKKIILNFTLANNLNWKTITI